MADAASRTLSFDWRIDADASALDAALAYVAGGVVPVFLHGVLDTENGVRCTCNTGAECRSAGKHPVLHHWQKNLAVDEGIVRDHHSRLRIRSPNVGLVLGEQPTGAYVVAVDVDDEGRFDQLRGELGPIPPTPRCDSGRGYRLFCRLPSGVPTGRLKNVSGIGGEPGVDAKVRGGQVVVAPSMHASGKRYAWVALGEVAELPMTWVDCLVADPAPPSYVREYTPETIAQDRRTRGKLERYLERAVTEECSRLARMPEGQRNTYLHQKTVSLLALARGCYLYSQRDYVVSALGRAAQHAGLDAGEVRRTLASAEAYVEREGATREPKSNGVAAATSVVHVAVPSAAVPDAPPDFHDAAPDVSLIQDRGQDAPIAENVARMLARHPDWRGGPRLDTFGHVVRWPTPIPDPLSGIGREADAVSDADAAAVQGWCVSRHLRASVETAENGILLASSRRSFDSLKERVSRLPPHDGSHRLDTWLVRYFGAPDGAVPRRVGRAWLVSALARSLWPGCVADGMLILEGVEGIGKNLGIEALFGEEWVGQLGAYQVGRHTEADRMAGSFWVLHDDELRSFPRARAENRKESFFSWLTRKKDTFRMPYGRALLTAPRRAVLVGSINPPYEYMEDDENRRFWPVRATRVDVDAILRDRDQILAEALVAATACEPWVITRDDPVWDELAEHRGERVPDDPVVLDVLMRLPRDAEAVTTRWVLDQLGVPPERRKASEQCVANALRKLGWVRQRAPRFVEGRPWLFVTEAIRPGVVLAGAAGGLTSSSKILL